MHIVTQYLVMAETEDSHTNEFSEDELSAFAAEYGQPYGVTFIPVCEMEEVAWDEGSALMTRIVWEYLCDQLYQGECKDMGMSILGNKLSGFLERGFGDRAVNVHTLHIHTNFLLPYVPSPPRAYGVQTYEMVNRYCAVPERVYDRTILFFRMGLPLQGLTLIHLSKLFEHVPFDRVFLAHIKIPGMSPRYFPTMIGAWMHCANLQTVTFGKFNNIIPFPRDRSS